MTQRIIPMVAYKDAAAAIDWLVEAFGFAEHRERYVIEDGTIGHAELELGGEIVMLATPNREYQSPRAHREGMHVNRSWLDGPYVVNGVHVEVDDVDARHARAVPAGATVLRAPEEPGIGFRIYTAEDLEGHRWMFAQRV